MSLVSATAIAPPILARSASPPSDRLAFIDGMRAIAIIAVVAFHAHLPGFGGGFVGVDVFFVISGFLITRQIVSQSLAGAFSATDFYARRILRIFPPLLLVTLATLALATLFPLLPQERRDLLMSGAATAAMISNYYFSGGTEYFSVHADINPLLHTWSLGVEEQYYLFVPAFTAAILAVAARRKWNPIAALLAFGAVAIVASYIALAILTQTDHRLAFFSIMTRSWQFAGGGMLAIATLRGRETPHRFSAALGLTGLVAIAAAVAFYNQHTKYPGLAAALAPTVGALALLAAGLGNPQAPLVRALASRPAVAIGLLSYSWYLWHWPLVELARTLAVGQDSVWKDVAASLVALLLAIPTYWLLERPLRRLRRPQIMRRFGGRIVAAGLAGSVAIALGALMLARGSAFDRNAPQIAMGAPAEPLVGCQRRAGLPRFHLVIPCVVGGEAEPNVVLWGDSHAQMLAPAAEWSARAAGRTAIVLQKPLCPPLLGIEIDFFAKRTCAASNDELLAWISQADAPPISGIVLAGSWLRYSEQDLPNGDADLPRLLWRDGNRPGGYLVLLERGLGDLLTALSPQRRVLIVGQVPELKHSPATCLMRAQLNGQSRQSCAPARAGVERRRSDAMAVLRRVAAQFPNVRLIDPLDVFCNREICWPFDAAGLFYSDDNHLTPLGVEQLYRHFERDFAWVYGERPVR